MRYLVLPLSNPLPSEQQGYHHLIASIVRKVANEIHMTPLGSEWDVNALFQFWHGLDVEDPIPDEFVSPIVSGDLNPDASSLLEMLLPHRERPTPETVVSILEQSVRDDLPLELDVRNRLERLLGTEQTPRQWMRLTEEEVTVLLNHRAFKDMPTGDVRPHDWFRRIAEAREVIIDGVLVKSSHAVTPGRPEDVPGPSDGPRIPPKPFG